MILGLANISNSLLVIHLGQDPQYWARFILAKVAKHDHALQIILAKMFYKKYSPGQ